MAEDTTRTSNRKLNSGASEYNALSFMMEQMIKGMVNTAIPVRVDSCTKPGVGGAAGYVSATPLVQQRGADGNALAPVSLPQLPYYRVQAGTAAVVLDPQPGDIGLAVFSQQDVSNVKEGTSELVQAGSFRCFDMSDGFYCCSVLGAGAPETYVHLDPETGEVTVKAPTKITLDAPTIELKGSLQMGNAAGSGTGDTMKITGNLDVTGSVKTDGNVTAGHFYGPVN
jgi:hypothetical protein